MLMLTLSAIFTITAGMLYTYAVLRVGQEIAGIPELKQKSNRLTVIIFTVCNVAIYLAIDYLKIQHYFYYIIAFVLFAYEFRHLGVQKEKSNVLSTYIALNTGTVFIGLLGLYALFKGVTPKVAFNDVALQLQISTMMFLVLTLMGTKTYRTIGKDSLKAILDNQKYSRLITILAIILCIGVAIDEYIVIVDAGYNQQLNILLATVFFNMIIYYSVVYHTVSTICVDEYQCRTTEAKVYYSHLKKHRKDMLKKTIKDELTQLYNKMYTMSEIKRAIHDVVQSDDDISYGLIFIDINGLKYVNDTIGHDAGDRLILRVANAIKGSIRDNREDVAGRIGGDEILILTANTSSGSLDIITNRIRANIEKENELEREFLVTVSIGALLITRDNAADGIDVILEEVDKLMRLDKEAFYNRQNN